MWEDENAEMIFSSSLQNKLFILGARKKLRGLLLWHSHCADTTLLVYEGNNICTLNKLTVLAPVFAILPELAWT